MAKPMFIIPFGKVGPKMRTPAFPSGAGSLRNHLGDIEYLFQIKVLNQFMIEGEGILLQTHGFNPLFQLLDFLSCSGKIRLVPKDPTRDMRVDLWSGLSEEAGFFSIPPGRCLRAGIEILSNVPEGFNVF